MTIKHIDEKHHVEATCVQPGCSVEKDPAINIQIIKTTNGQAIPDNEPIILFRGRDKLALPMLEFYRKLCVVDGATQYQLDSMDKMIKIFEEFAKTSSTMKQPGCTLGK